MSKILAAMSGGVDSSVAAALLVDQGHEVVGAYMKNWINEENIAGHCPWGAGHHRDARAVCEKLGIEFRVVNLMRDYKDRVVEYLLRGLSGRSHAESRCDVQSRDENSVFSWTTRSKRALKVSQPGTMQGFATTRTGPGISCAGSIRTRTKTYFLALMRQEQIRHALFPIGELPKPEVRQLAEKFDLPTASKKDSQGICFIGEVKMSDFLRHYVPDDPGDIVTIDGKKVGEHRGLHLFTLGQRKGHGVPSNAHKQSLRRCRKTRLHQGTRRGV